MYLEGLSLALHLHPTHVEEGMILTAEHPATNLYRVEVSGWDDNKSFFVENFACDRCLRDAKQNCANRAAKRRIASVEMEQRSEMVVPLVP